MQILFLLIVAFINLFLCILVFTRAANRTPRYFAISSLFVVFWGLGTLAMLFARDPTVTRIGLITFCIAPMITAYFMALFAASFIGVKERTLTITSLFLLAVLLITAAWTIGHIDHSVLTIASGTLAVNTVDLQSSWFIIYSLDFVFSFSASYMFFLYGLLTGNAKFKRTIRPMFAGIFAASFLATFTNIILPLAGNSMYLWLGPIWTLFYVFTTSFAMVRHRLFDVRLFAVRSLGYFLSLVTLALVYLVIAYVISRLFFQNGVTNNVSFSPINIVLALLLAFIFQPVKNFFDRITNRIFYRDRYNAEEFFAVLSNVLGATVDLNSLLIRASEVIGETLKSEQAFFYVRNEKHGRIVAGTSGHAKLLMSEADHLDHYMNAETKKVLTVEELSVNKTIFAILSRHKISILLPLYHDAGIMGYLALGEQLTGSYRKRDLKVLETIADELVIAIQNAMSLEEVRELNANLQQRIDGATRDLRSKNERLKELDNTKDEFISMASHQLRTPLTSVKGYISMILDGDAGTVTDSQRRFLEEAFDSSVRMAGIIGDFLNVSRLQTGKFMLEKSEVNLAEIAESEVEHLQNTARMRGLTIHYKKPTHFPLVTADKSKIEQVMMNFMDNALFYAPNSKTVEVELKEDGGKAIFTVRDHGIGVPKQEQAGLFTKFFRATNARKQRPDGTGVGIFLAKKVITAHHGDIIFESEEGKGSTFGFTLPLLNETGR